MYKSSKYESSNSINLSIPWDSNTAKGWFLSIGLLSLLLFISTFIKVKGPEKRTLPPTESLVLLNFGDGDGTGISKGNLQEEGKASKGPKPEINIEDAQRAAPNKRSSNQTTSIDQSSNVKPVDEMSNRKKEESRPDGTSKKNVGTAEPGNDDLLARGLGDIGRGTGAGHGFGDIEWGGGGNRKVLNKVVPSYPDGVRASSKIVLQIRVLPDGTVSKVVTKRKGDPRLEIAAVKALKQWRFNPIDSNQIMIGEIPLNFVIR